MDPKASAKSKRSHTQRGRKSNPTPSAIALKKKQQPPQPTAAAAAGGAQGEEKPKRIPGRSLPSNWDRYEEDEDEDEMVSGSGEATLVGAKLGFGDKSRGADFGYLIEQARSQKPEDRQLDPVKPFPLEDFSFDFMQGTSLMLAAKGKGLASWLEDDNFIMDEPTSSFEVPFLSMDLHAIADRLSTVKLSERLFIEADFFPEELLEESKVRQIHDEAESSKKGRQEDGLGSGSSNRQAWSEKNVERVNTDKFDSDLGIRVEKYHLLPSRGDVSTNAEISQSKLSQISLPESSMQTVQGLEQEATSKFKAADAEAELDMLLDSLGETNISGSHFQSDSMALPYDSALNALANAGPSPTPLRVVGPTSLDDGIDGLLGGTSINIEVKQDASLLPKTGANPSAAASVLFDANISSGQPTRMSTLDDNLDDLLAETSLQDTASLNQARKNPSIQGSLFLNGDVLLGQPIQTSTLDVDLDDLLAEKSVSLGSPKNTIGLQKQGTSSVNFSSIPPLGAHAMDDFDSWFDSIQ